MTNLERIQEYANKTNDPTLTIHPIAQTGLWLVGQKPKENCWKIYICNPFQTTVRLVSKSATNHEYMMIWRLLTLTTFEPNTKLKRALDIAKKQVASYKLNKFKLKKVQKYYGNSIHNNSKSRKGSRKKHLKNAKSKQVDVKKDG